MFCQTCGGAINPGLSYCNHCGARTGGTNDGEHIKLSEKSFGLLVCALAILPIAGLALIIGLIGLMKKEMGFENEMIFVFALMSFVLLLASEGALFWLLLTRFKNPKRSGDNIPPPPNTAQLNKVEIKGLNEARQGGIYDAVPTVTEHTTRSLDAVPLPTKKR
jgi:hypothetical protein